MGELEEKLNSLLSSPKDMEKILSLARELGGQERQSAPPPGEPAMDLDPRLLSLLMKLMGEMNRTDDRQAALVSAMKPYVRGERREALDRALRLTKLLRAVSLVSGGELHLGL